MQKEKGQTQFILIGIMVVLLVVGATIGFNFLGNSNEPETLEPATTTGGTGEVITPGEPVRSDLFPTGTLSAGTKETTISVSLDRPGYCRYSTESGKSYDSMRERFSYNNDKTFHSKTIKSLKDGQLYEYFIRCQDLFGNKNNSDAVIQFSVGGYVSAPKSSSGSSGNSDSTPLILSGLFPTGTLPAGATNTKISVSTSRSAYCRYSTESGKSYDSMRERFSYNNNKTLHTAIITGLADNKVYQYFVRCRDLNNNESVNEGEITFGVGPVIIPSSGLVSKDILPPYRSNGSPSKNVPYYTKQTLISLNTNEKAVCKYYSDVSGINYGSMKIFSNTDSTFHSTEVTGLSENQEYKYYVKCADDSNNVNSDDFVISFKVEVPKDLTPPIRSNLYPDRDLYSGTTETLISLSTDEFAYCRYSNESGIPYKSMNKSFTRGEANAHYTIVKGLEDGKTYTFFIRCKDVAGNENTGDVMLKFRVVP